MNDDRPDTLLKSALEKIVYFEARSEQVASDLTQTKAEAERLKAELAQAAQREIDLRRQMAELEVQLSRAHREREEGGRLNEALRSERATLIGRLLEASRIHGAGDAAEAEGDFDLARFISELRGEVIARDMAKKESTGEGKWAAATVAPSAHSVAGHAERLRAEGRLGVSAEQMEDLSARSGFSARSEETLFGFSIRELASPDVSARIRAAERLKSLGTRAAAPALATALHGESDPSVQAVLLSALSVLGSTEAAAVAGEQLASPSPEVRTAALRAVVALDASQAGRHLTQAMKDPDRLVRRSASLLSLGLPPEAALALGEQAFADTDPEVRALAARVLGAAGGEKARARLLSALRDVEAKVRKAAADGLSQILGQDVSGVASLEDGPRRREVRRLATLPSRPPELRENVRAGHASPSLSPRRAGGESLEPLCAQVAAEVRCAIRGRSTSELVSSIGAPTSDLEEACALLAARGQVVRRGTKYFAA